MTSAGAVPAAHAQGLMAAFFDMQLDFILFFYGLAFVLLGVTCVAGVPAAVR